jgi:hypothetical protein
MSEIPGFPGYTITSEGVLTSPFGRAVSQPVARVGYRLATVFVGGRKTKQYIHRLVALAFHGEPPSGAVARHLDGNKLNNRAANLAWGAYAENTADSYRHGTMIRGEEHHAAKLTDLDVAEIKLRVSVGETQAAVARRFGVDPSHVCNLVKHNRRRRAA